MTGVPFANALSVRPCVNAKSKRSEMTDKQVTLDAFLKANPDLKPGPNDFYELGLSEGARLEREAIIRLIDTYRKRIQGSGSEAEPLLDDEYRHLSVVIRNEAHLQ